MTEGKEWNLIPDNIENLVFLNHHGTLYFNTKEEPQTIKFNEIGFGKTVYNGTEVESKEVIEYKKIIKFDSDTEVVKIFGTNSTLFVLLCYKNRVSKRFILQMYNFATKDFFSGKSKDFELKFDNQFDIESSNLTLVNINDKNLNYIFISNKKKIIYCCLQYLDKGFTDITDNISSDKYVDNDLVIAPITFEEEGEKKFRNTSGDIIKNSKKKQYLFIYENTSKKILRLELKENTGLIYIKEVTKTYKKIPTDRIKGISVINFASNVIFNKKNDISHPKQSLLILYSENTIYTAKNIFKSESIDFMPLLTTGGGYDIKKPKNNLLDFNVFKIPGAEYPDWSLKINFLCPMNNFGLFFGDSDKGVFLFLSTQNTLTQKSFESSEIDYNQEDS